jgi:hypothetical protein
MLYINTPYLFHTEILLVMQLLFTDKMVPVIWRVWIYQRGNQNPEFEEEQTTQYPKEKAQEDKQRSTKHIHKTKDRITRPPL